MYCKEWNVIKKNFVKYLPEGVTVHYVGRITNKFPEIRPIEGPESFYTDPDYDKNAILSILVGSFETYKKDEIELCIKNLISKLEELKYDVIERPDNFSLDSQGRCRIWFKKPITYLYLTDDSEE